MTKVTCNKNLYVAFKVTVAETTVVKCGKLMPPRKEGMKKEVSLAAFPLCVPLLMYVIHFTYVGAS